MNVMHIIESLEAGGAEKVLVDIVNNLPAQFKSSICCLKASGAMAKNLIDPQIPVVELHKKNGNDYSVPRTLSKILRQSHIDIVHAHNWNTFCESIVSAALAGTPRIVHTIHGHHVFYENSFKGKIKKGMRHGIERYLSHRSYRICTVSEAVKDYIIKDIKICKSKVQVVINGIDPSISTISSSETRQMLGLLDDDFVICFVGRLAKVKNIESLISVMTHFDMGSSNVRLLILGDGPERENLQNLARQLNLENSISWLGYQTRPRDIMSASDLFVLPSHYEGISIALLEAMAEGLPAIATDVGGNRQIIIPDQTGVLVPPGDSKQLFLAIRSIIEAPEKRMMMSENARNRIGSKFSIQRMINAYTRIYSELPMKFD